MNAGDRLVRQTIDRVGINDLLSSYADVVNRRAFGELEELFLPDAQIVIDARRGEPREATGGAQLGEFIGGAIARFDFFEFVILSSRLWVDGSDAATGRLYLSELRHDRTTGESSQAFGVYHDGFRRVDERWWFSSRAYHSLARTSTSDDRALDVFDFPSE